MTDQHRNNLLTACAFAKVFMEAVEGELKTHGYTSELWTVHREQSAAELAAALRNLNPPAPDVPVVDWNAVGRELDHE